MAYTANPQHRDEPGTDGLRTKDYTKRTTEVPVAGGRQLVNVQSALVDQVSHYRPRNNMDDPDASCSSSFAWLLVRSSNEPAALSSLCETSFMKESSALSCTPLGE